MKKVLFVREGRWGLRRESYNDSHISIAKEMLEDGGMAYKIVNTAEDAFNELSGAEDNIVVFFSRGAINEAQMLIDRARENNILIPRIIIFTALVPDDVAYCCPNDLILAQNGHSLPVPRGEIIWAEKSCLLDMAAMIKMLDEACVSV